MREVSFMNIPDDCAWRDGNDCFRCPYCLETAGDTAVCTRDGFEEDTTIW